jgi:hypothetical protein
MVVNLNRARWLGYFAAGLFCVVPCSGCGDSVGTAPQAAPPSGGTVRVDANADMHPPAAASGSAMGSPVASAGHSSDGDINLGKIHLTAPKSWEQREPRMPGFILAEFALPKVAGDADNGRLTISAAQGGVQGNIERWRKQFGGKPEKESTEKMEVAGVAITLVDFSGTFQDQRGGMMMGGETVERPGYRMLGAIIDVGEEQLYFVKAYGPAKTMAAHADEFRALLRSLKKT